MVSWIAHAEIAKEKFAAAIKVVILVFTVICTTGHKVIKCATILAEEPEKTPTVYSKSLWLSVPITRSLSFLLN